MLFHKSHALYCFVNFICGYAPGSGCPSIASCHVADLAAMDHGGSSAGHSGDDGNLSVLTGSLDDMLMVNKGRGARFFREEGQENDMASIKHAYQIERSECHFDGWWLD